jgi:enoyl-CoA hydratase/carnithine racemase
LSEICSARVIFIRCRLPRLVGLQQAIQMMLTSTPIGDKAGLKAGLLDAVVPQQQLLAAAKQRALDIAAGRLPRLFSLQRTGEGMGAAVAWCGYSCCGWCFVYTKCSVFVTRRG